MTAEESFRFPADGVRHELVDGARGITTARIAARLTAHVEDGRDPRRGPPGRNTAAGNRFRGLHGTYVTETLCVDDVVPGWMIRLDDIFRPLVDQKREA